MTWRVGCSSSPAMGTSRVAASPRGQLVPELSIRARRALCARRLLVFHRCLKVPVGNSYPSCPSGPWEHRYPAGVDSRSELMSEGVRGKPRVMPRQASRDGSPALGRGLGRGMAMEVA